MLNIPENLRLALRSDNCQNTLYIAIGSNISVQSSYVKKDSFKLSESVMGDITEFAGCKASKLEITMHDMASTEYESKPIKVEIMVNNDSEHKIPLFRGYIDSAEYDSQEQTYKFVCYDGLYWILNSTSFPDGELVYKWYKTFLGKKWHTLKEFRNALFTKLGMTQAYNIFSGSLPNDGIKIKKRFNNKDMTVLELVQGLCQISGCCGIINRLGQFEWRYISDGELTRTKKAYPGCFYPGEMYPSQEITEKVTTGAEEEISVYNDLVYSDFVLKPLKQFITVRNNADDSGQYVSNNPSDKKHYYKGFVTSADDDTDRDRDDPAGDDDDEMITGAYVLEGNMFAYKLKAKNKKIAAANLWNRLGQDIGFRTYSVTTYGLPYVEIGDRIKVAGKTFIVTSRELTGEAVMWDKFYCNVDYEQAEFITTAQPSVINKNEVDEAEVRQIATDTSNDVTKDVITNTFTNPETGERLQMLCVVSFADGILKTKTVEVATNTSGENNNDS